MMVISVSNNHATFLQIDSLDVAIEKMCPAQQLAHRIDDVRQVQIASRYFMQHRREQKEVLAIDEREFNIRVATKLLLKMQGRIETAEAAPENQDSPRSV
jgi:hypothetical protein